MNTEVIAASVQPREITTALAHRLGITYPILFDERHQMAQAFGVYNLPGGMGRFSAHSMFLIDREGRIVWSEVSPREMYIQPDKVLQEVRKLARTQ